MATVGSWRRYVFPSRAIAIDFDGPTLTTAAVVNLSTGEAVPLADEDWFHLVERAKYMRSLAVPQHGGPKIDYGPVRAGLPEPDWHVGCSGCWRTVSHLS